MSSHSLYHTGSFCPQDVFENHRLGLSGLDLLINNPPDDRISPTTSTHITGTYTIEIIVFPKFQLLTVTISSALLKKMF